MKSDVELLKWILKRNRIFKYLLTAILAGTWFYTNTLIAFWLLSWSFLMSLVLFNDAITCKQILEHEHNNLIQSHIEAIPLYNTVMFFLVLVSTAGSIVRN